MIKEKLQRSIYKRLDRKRALEMARKLGWDKKLHSDFKSEQNNRRRNRIKAKRLSIRHECPSCGVHNFAMKIGKIKEKPSHYQRYEDVWIRNYCEECRWLMKGGMH